MRYMMPLLLLFSFLNAKTIEISKSTIMDENELQKIYEKFIDKKYPQKVKEYREHKEYFIHSFKRDDAKEVVVDNVSGLMWQDNSDAKRVKKNWNDAKRYCQKLSFAGYDGWYLPSLSELNSIVDKGREPTLAKEFKNTVSSDYWSSSAYTNNTNNAWIVYFDGGNQYYSVKTNSFYVRCVRVRQ